MSFYLIAARFALFESLGVGIVLCFNETSKQSGCQCGISLMLAGSVREGK